MYNINLTDETFDINRLDNYNLLVQISDKSFAYSLYDNHRNKFVLLRSTEIKSDNTSKYIETISSVITKDEIIPNIKTQIKILFYNKNTIIVPNAFYNEDKKHEILGFNVSIDKNDIILSNKLRNNDYNIFSINNDLLNFLNEKFSNNIIYNQASIIINENTLNSAKDKTKIIIDSNSNFIDVTLIEKGNLKFKNTFEYKTTTDFVFFVLNIYDKFELQPEKVEIYISGKITSISDEVLLLKNYIKKIKFLKTSLNYSYIFNDIKISEFTNLLNLQNCV